MLDEPLQFLEEDNTSHFTAISKVTGAWSGAVLACPGDWGGLLGTAIASHAGMSAPPARGISEPEVADEDRKGLISWLLGADWSTPLWSVVWHPVAATGVDTRRLPTANDRTRAHLTRVASSSPVRRTGLLVFGDSADDFALARLWRLTHGDGYWVPSAFGSDQPDMRSTFGWPSVGSVVDSLEDAVF